MRPYYRDEYATIWHGDCREILPTLPDVDLVLTDPPYNVGVDYGEGHDDKMADEAFVAWASVWFRQCRAKAGTVLISTGNPQLAFYALIEPWKWLLCWYKPAAMGRGPVGFNAWEPVAMWGKGSAAGLPDVFTAPIIPQRDTGAHPCPKPVEWASALLARFPKTTSVLDPFAGSGTTLVAAKAQNVRAIGIEIEERFCEIAANRLRQGVLDLAGDGVGDDDGRDGRPTEADSGVGRPSRPSLSPTPSFRATP